MENLVLSLVGNADEPAIWFVCLLGVGVVFVGLFGIVLLLSLVNVICSRLEGMRKPKAADAPPTKTAESDSPALSAEARQEIIAAVCAAVAEENGTDISAIRVVSFKKL